MKHPFSGSFLRTVFSIIAAAVLPAIAIVILTGVERQGDAVRRSEELAMSVVHAAARIQDTLAASSRTLLTTMATMDVVRSHQANLPDFLDRLGFSHPAYADIFVVNDRGHIVASNTGADDSFRVVDREYFSGSVKKEELIPGTVTYSRLSRIPIFHFSYGIRYDARRSLVLVTGIRLSYYNYVLGGLPVPQNAILSLADRKGRLVASLPDTGEEFGTLPYLLEEAISEKKEKEGLFYFETDQGRQLIAYTRIALAESPDEPYMTAVLAIPEEAALEGISALQRRNLFWLFLALVATTGFGLMFVYIVLLPPVHAMLDAARSYAAGDFTSRPDTLSAVSEFNELAQSMGTMADAIENQETELMAARDAADSAGKAKGEFLANMSHEIRTPLNAIIGMAYLALKSTLTPRQKGYLSKIHEAGQELLKVINNILELSKLDAGKLGMESISFTMRDIFAENKRHFSAAARGKGIGLHFTLAPDTPRYLIGDPLRLGQIIGHLIDNAIRHTETGSVTVTCQLESLNARQAHILVVIKDTGPGMSESRLTSLQRLFSSEEVAVPEGDRPSSAGGLGLLLVHKLIRAMGGVLTLESEPGKGSAVLVRLAFGTREGQRLPRTTFMAGVRCLAVDDDTVTLGLIKDLLENFGIKTETETDPRQGLEALLRADREGRPFELMIIDWRMPDIDGVELTRQIRAKTELMNQPAIIMLSAYGWSGILLQAEEAGVDSFLHKPINESVLLDTIMTLLQPQGRAEEEGPAEESDGEAAAADLEGLHVLVVEDNTVNQQIAQEILAGAGMRVALADNGEKALEFFDPMAPVPPFAVVLMDLQMPVMDGFEAARRLRAMQAPWAADLPLIAMTAHNRSVEKEGGGESDLNDHVGKPIDVGELFSLLRRWRPPVAVQNREHAAAFAELKDRLAGQDPAARGMFEGMRPMLKKYLHEGRLARLEGMIRNGRMLDAAAFLTRLNSVLQFAA